MDIKKKLNEDCQDPSIEGNELYICKEGQW